jgi:hypothetical protein
LGKKPKYLAYFWFRGHTIYGVDPHGCNLHPQSKSRTQS